MESLPGGWYILNIERKNEDQKEEKILELIYLWRKHRKCCKTSYGKMLMNRGYPTSKDLSNYVHIWSMWYAYDVHSKYEKKKKKQTKLI